ncbi:MAG: ATP phosphoribosyltransferase regulatory subunit [Spirochaetales bacterium]|jgi:ATP phosphoribosyltransferase regulatory subunit|nr:ATP phosphoribosyltransferase regulatory subunit [Spirochaetales bacterium]
MNPNSRAFLQLPQGTEGFYLEEALEHEETVRSLKKLFVSWGYLPVQTPVFDFYDIYRPFVSQAAAEKIYRLVDREGELLMLRPDVTLFLAKQLGRLEKRDLPLRVFYADSILRHQDAEDISRNEFYQVGAELIGQGGLFADLEALMLLVGCLRTAGLEDYHIHLGSREFFSAVFRGVEETLADGASGAAEAVSLRDTLALRDILSRAGRGEGEVDFLVELFLYIGDPAGLRRLVERGKTGGYINAGMQSALDYICLVWGQLEELGVAGLFRLDLSETASQNYYTGIVFQAYKEGIDSAFASGGRYDKLLARFGFDAPSVGFSLMLSKIKSSLSGFRGSEPRLSESAGGKTFAEAFRAAEEKRKSGVPVIIKGSPS